MNWLGMLISFFFQKSIIVLKKSIFFRLSNLGVVISLCRGLLCNVPCAPRVGLVTSAVGLVFRSLSSLLLAVYSWTSVPDRYRVLLPHASKRPPPPRRTPNRVADSVARRQRTFSIPTGGWHRTHARFLFACYVGLLWTDQASGCTTLLTDLAFHHPQY